MNQEKPKPKTAVRTPILGWLLLTMEERRLLQAYVELSLTQQTPGDARKRNKRDRLIA
jgi:hypothetical protein